MGYRLIGHVAVALALATTALQTTTAAQSTNGAAPAAARFEPKRTAWGDPDLQGHWLPGGGGMMEAPAGEPYKSTTTKPGICTI